MTKSVNVLIEVFVNQEKYLNRRFTREVRMKKFFKKTYASALIVVILALVFITIPVSVDARRGTEAVFYGRVVLDGQNVPEGSMVIAKIAGTLVCQSPIYYRYGMSRYVASVFVDEPGVAGGKKGDKVYFTLIVDGKYYENNTPSTWALGQDIPRTLYFEKSITPDVKIITSELPEGVVTVSYTNIDESHSQVVLEANGGVLPYKWQASDLPLGLNCTEDGIISGTPEASGQYSPIFMVTDSTLPVNLTASKTLSIRIWDIGDADHSGSVDSNDVLLAVTMYLFDQYTISADVNQDGKIDMMDVVLIRNMCEPIQRNK
jgi:hypothetical protein